MKDKTHAKEADSSSVKTCSMSEISGLESVIQKSNLRGFESAEQGVLGGPIQSIHSIRLSECYTVMEHKTRMCLIFGWIYDEAECDREHGIAPGTKWEDVPMNWTCPECAARKEDFEMVAI